MRRVVAVALAVVVGVGVLAGCSAAATEPVGLTAGPTAATVSPTPTPTKAKAVTGVVQDLSDPVLGIVFEAVPAVQGDAADVYNWIATFEKEYWRTMTTNQVSPAFSIMASAEVQATMKRIATNNLNDQVKIGGVFHVTVAGITVDGGGARATMCDDYRNATFADVKGIYTPESAGFGENSLLEVKLVRGPADGQWLIQSESRMGTC